jgi:hypothetical protein
MFIYGNDIPLEEAILEETAPTSPRQPVEPMEFPFEYGKDIFPVLNDES